MPGSPKKCSHGGGRAERLTTKWGTWRPPRDQQQQNRAPLLSGSWEVAFSDHGCRPHHAVGMPTGTRPWWGHPAGPGARGDPTSASKPAARRSPRHFPPSRASLPNVLQWPSPQHCQRLETSNKTRVWGVGGRSPRERGLWAAPAASDSHMPSRALGTKPEPLNVPLGPVLSAHRLSVSATKESLQF